MNDYAESILTSIILTFATFLIIIPLLKFSTKEKKTEYVHPVEIYISQEGDSLYVKRDTLQCIEVTYQRTKPKY